MADSDYDEQARSIADRYIRKLNDGDVKGAASIEEEHAAHWNDVAVQIRAIVDELADEAIDYQRLGDSKRLKELLEKNSGTAEQIRAAIAETIAFTNAAQPNTTPAESELHASDLRHQGLTFGESGQYTVGGRLGFGAFGAVHVVKNSGDPESRLVVKILQLGRTRASWQEAKRRFLDEIKLIERHQDSACVVKLVEAGEFESGEPYYVMRRYEGTAQDLLGMGNRTNRFRVGMHIRLRALERFLSEFSKIVGVTLHRDLSSRNLLMEETLHGGAVRKVDFVLCDFGLGKDLADEGRTVLSGSLRSGVGARDFMAPEQLMRFEKASEVSEVFSLGLLAWFCTTGRVPRFALPSHLQRVADGSEQNRYANDYRLESLARLPQAKRLADVPAAVSRVIEIATELEPELRYQTVEEFARDFTAAVAGDRVTAKRSLRKRIIEQAWWYPGRLVGGLAGLVCIVILTLFAWDEYRDNEAVKKEHEQTLKLNKDLKEEKARLFAAKQALDESVRIADRNAREAEDNLYKFVIRDAQKLRAVGDSATLKVRLDQIPQSCRSIDDAMARRAGESQGIQLCALHDGPVTDFLVDEPAGLVVSGGLDGRLLVSELATAELKRTLVEGIFIEETEVSDRTVVIGNRYSLAIEKQGPKDFTRSLAWLKKGEQFLEVSHKGKLRVWDIDGTAEEVLELDGEVSSIAVSFDRGRALIGQTNGKVLLVDIAAKAATTSTTLDGNVTDVAWVVSGWVVGMESGELKLLSPDIETEVYADSVQGPVHDLAATKEGRRLLAATGLRDLTMWDLEGSVVKSRTVSLRESSISEMGSETIEAVSFAPDNSTVDVGLRTGTILRLAIDSLDGEPLASLRLRVGSTIAGLDQFSTRMQRRVVALIREGETLYASCCTGAVTAAKHSSETTESKWHPKSFVLPTGFQSSQIVEVCRDGDIHLRDLAAMHKTVTQASTLQDVVAASMSKNDVLVVASKKGEVAFYQVGTTAFNRVRKPLKLEAISTCAISPDGTKLAVLHSSHELKLIDLESNDVLGTYTLPVHGNEPVRVLFSGNGDTFIVFGIAHRTIVLSSKDASRVSEPVWMSAGRYGTAVARSPIGNVFIGGDDTGTVYFSDRRATGLRTDGPVKALAYVAGSNAAARVIVVDRHGNVVFGDAATGTMSFSFKFSSASKAEPQDLVVTSNLGYVTLVYADGTAVTRRTGVRGERQFHEDTNRWTGRALADGLESIPRDFTVLPDDSIAAIDLVDQTDSQDKELRLLHLDTHNGSFSSYPIRTLTPPEQDPSGSIICSSLSLNRSDSEVLGVFRSPTKRYGAHGGLFRVSIESIVGGSPSFSLTTIEPEMNGFLTGTVLLDPDGQPHWVHQLMANFHCLLSSEDSTGWKHRMFGRQGDGLRSQACMVGSNVVNVSPLMRSFGDIDALFLTTYNVTQKKTDRCLVGPDLGHRGYCVCEATGNEAVVIFGRPHLGGGTEVVAATFELAPKLRKTSNKILTVFPSESIRMAGSQFLSRERLAVLVGREKGRYHFYLRDAAGNWTSELLPGSQGWTQAHLMKAHGGEPLILIFRESGNRFDCSLLTERLKATEEG